MRILLCLHSPKKDIIPHHTEFFLCLHSQKNDIIPQPHRIFSVSSFSKKTTLSPQHAEFSLCLHSPKKRHYPPNTQNFFCVFILQKNDIIPPPHSIINDDVQGFQRLAKKFLILVFF